MIIDKKMGLLQHEFAAQAGIVSAFAGITVPEGYLLCDGSAISRTQYADLFSAIGTLYGAGDESTTFNLPDFRGKFLRGYLNGTSAELGVLQADELKSHSHSVTGGQGVQYTTNWAENSNDGNMQGINRVNLVAGATGGNETRPVNYAVNYIIKY